MHPHVSSDSVPLYESGSARRVVLVGGSHSIHTVERTDDQGIRRRDRSDSTIQIQRAGGIPPFLPQAVSRVSPLNDPVFRSHRHRYKILSGFVASIVRMLILCNIYRQHNRIKE